MTEEEAKTLWCPFVRITAETEHMFACNNRCSQLSVESRIAITSCIGSACMAWRWDEAKETPAARTGHCGLAGKP